MTTSVREYTVLYLDDVVDVSSSVAGGNVSLVAGAHRLDGSEHTPPIDSTDLDASTTAHGLLPKLPGGLERFLRGDGTFPIIIHTATADPGVGDDSGDGYVVGTLWINTSSDEAFVLVDSTLGAAVWISTTAGGSLSLDDLSDVDTTTTPPVAGDVLIFDGSEWVPGAAAGGSSSDQMWRPTMTTSPDILTTDAEPVWVPLVTVDGEAVMVFD